MTLRRATLVLACAIAGDVALEGHHSIAGAYDVQRQSRVSAVITEVRFVNPHPFLVVEVTDSTTGRGESWRLEMDNLRELVAVGMTAGTLKPGDRIDVSGSPARTQSRQLYVRRLDRPADGFWYEQVGSSPRIGSAQRPS